MNILVALDASAQSDFVVREVARLAGNTWADVTLLGIEPGANSSSNSVRTDQSHPLATSLRSQREKFLAHFGTKESPYSESTSAYEWVEVQKGLWEDLKVCRGARKRLNTRIRSGSVARAIAAETREYPCDLIVIGNAAADNGGDPGRSVKKAIKETDASVLLVANNKQPRRIVACLDHDNVSQPSMEMINQMVTLYRADLEIVGVTAAGGLSDNLDRKMGKILKYYAESGVKALVRIVEQSSLEAFATQAARDNLVALWMGKQSLLRRIIPPRGVDRLLDIADASVLILR